MRLIGLLWLHGASGGPGEGFPTLLARMLAAFGDAADAETANEDRGTAPANIAASFRACCRGVYREELPAQLCATDEAFARTANVVARSIHPENPMHAPDVLYQQLLSSIADSNRRKLGAFYTPPALIDHVLEQTLSPVLDRCLLQDPTGESLLALRVLDPACGSGRFLIAAARMIGERLIAARSRIESDGAGPAPAKQNLCAAIAEISRRCIFGMDIDPVAMDLCRLQFVSETYSRSDAQTGLGQPTLRLGDALMDDSLWGNGSAVATRPGDIPTKFDVVLGNPPFLNQLESQTANKPARAKRIAELSSGAVRGYADTAGAFLLLGLRLTWPDGRVGMVQPLSLLASRDNGPLRAALLDHAWLESIWIDDGRTFQGIATQTCACVFQSRRDDDARSAQASAEPGPRLFVGPMFRAVVPRAPRQRPAASAATWSALACEAFGIPPPPRPRASPLNDCSSGRSTRRGGDSADISETAVIADIAHATADFRAQYYGLVGRIVESTESPPPPQTPGPAEPPSPPPRSNPALPPVITAGLIDLAQCKWGRVATIIHGQTWQAPAADLAALSADPDLIKWAVSRLVPKVLVATQTPLIEAVVDERGQWLPSVPVLTITSRTPDDSMALWRLASALASPVCCTTALAQTCGTALTVTAIKLSAKAVLTLPLPRVETLWQESAAIFRAASTTNNAADRSAALLEFAAVSIASHGLTGQSAREHLDWWRLRLTRPSRCKVR